MKQYDDKDKTVPEIIILNKIYVLLKCFHIRKQYAELAHANCILKEIMYSTVVQATEVPSLSTMMENSAFICIQKTVSVQKIHRNESLVFIFSHKNFRWIINLKNGGLFQCVTWSTCTTWPIDKTGLFRLKYCLQLLQSVQQNKFLFNVNLKTFHCL